MTRLEVIGVIIGVQLFVIIVAALAAEVVWSSMEYWERRLT